MILCGCLSRSGVFCFWFLVLLAVDSQVRQSPFRVRCHCVLLLGDRLRRRYLGIRSRSLYPLFICGFLNEFFVVLFSFWRLYFVLLAFCGLCVSF